MGSIRSVAYANAKNVLPGTLLRKVQAYFQGGLLWIPPIARRRLKTRKDAERNRRIFRDKAKGLSTTLLAEKYGLSEERIRQVLREAKRNA
jgi:Mor family transcriptional regulator